LVVAAHVLLLPLLQVISSAIGNEPPPGGVITALETSSMASTTMGVGGLRLLVLRDSCKESLEAVSRIEVSAAVICSSACLSGDSCLICGPSIASVLAVPCQHCATHLMSLATCASAPHADAIIRIHVSIYFTLARPARTRLTR
jgi:hypothetical protein